MDEYFQSERAQLRSGLHTHADIKICKEEIHLLQQIQEVKQNAEWLRQGQVYAYY